MNGVRRFLVGGSQSTSSTPSSQSIPLPTSTPSPPSQTIPPNVPPKPSWPPSSSSPPQSVNGHDESPRGTTAALFFRKDRQRAPPMSSASGSAKSDEDTGNSHSSRDSVESGRTSTQPSSPVAGPSSPRMNGRMSSRKPVDVEGKRSSASYTAKDELLMSLLASEAIVDSRGCEVLSAEEVEELKKEHQVLSSRLVAATKKLTLETKIRDAAQSLSMANASYKAVSKQSTDQLDNANRKVEVAQKEVWRISERVAEINRKLLEHRTAVLSYSLRSMEKKMSPPDGANGGDPIGTGYSTPNRSSTMSPTRSSVASAHSSSSRTRWDGAHFFAGHSDAIVPSVPKPPGSSAEVTSLQEELKTAQMALEAASAQRQTLSEELSSMRAEKRVLESSKSVELRQAEEMVAALDRQVGEMQGLGEMVAVLESEKRVWAKDRAELEERRREVDILERRLELLEEQSGEMSEIQSMLARERQDVEEQASEIAELKAERAMLLTEKSMLQMDGESKAQLEQGVDALQELMKRHGVSHYSRDTSIRGLAMSIEKHLDEGKAKVESLLQAQDEWSAVRAKLEIDLRVGLDKREVLNEQLDEARRERDGARADARALEARLRDIQESDGPVIQYVDDAAKITAVLEPLWTILPSPEGRAQKLGKKTPAPAVASPTTMSSPIMSKGGSSLSEMDVRSLKTLYDPNAFPLSTRPSGDVFSVEAFASRVQALIADDRALIERLIRFAQAHDLLKKNAERAQKLAQESNVALETYQKQVKLLEDRNVSMVAKQTALHDEVANLQEAIERIGAEKAELEAQAAAQADMCQQLAEANDSLVLKLAEDSNGASDADAVRKKLEAELAECKSALERAQDEIEAVRMSQQTQQMAILEELNSMQTENSNLRAQLRKK